MVTQVFNNYQMQILDSISMVQSESELIEKDKDDNKFVDCAIKANAKYIVSEDHHFDVLRDIPFPKVDVIGI